MIVIFRRDTLKVHEAMATNPITLGLNASVSEAAQLIRDNKIGSVIIVEKEKVLGIATERDLIRRVLAENKDPKTLKISEVMTSPVISISLKEDVVDAAQLMRINGIRRLAVMEGNRLVGIITTNDLAKNMKRAVQDLATKFYLMDLY